MVLSYLPKFLHFLACRMSMWPVSFGAKLSSISRYASFPGVENCLARLFGEAVLLVVWVYREGIIGSPKHWDPKVRAITEAIIPLPSCFLGSGVGATFGVFDRGSQRCLHKPTCPVRSGRQLALEPPPPKTLALKPPVGDTWWFWTILRIGSKLGRNWLEIGFWVEFGSKLARNWVEIGSKLGSKLARNWVLGFAGDPPDFPVVPRGNVRNSVAGCGSLTPGSQTNFSRGVPNGCLRSRPRCVMSLNISHTKGQESSHASSS